MVHIDQNVDFDMSKVRFQTKRDIKLGETRVFSKLAGCSVYHFSDAKVKGSCPLGVPCWSSKNDSRLYKNECYCGKTYNLYKKDSIPCHARNTIAVREHMAELQQKLSDDLKRAKKCVQVRIHQSGELESAEELMMWVNIAMNNPRHTFGIYTKRVDIVKSVVDEIESFPKNFVVNVSVWGDTNEKFGRWFVMNRLGNVFGVLADFTDINPEHVTDCPAYRGGKLNHEITCDKCGKCYRNKSKFILCNLH